jgi:hypothetical protein
VPKALPLWLLLTRISIVIFLAPWVYLRLTKLEAGKGLFAKYYQVSDMPDAVAYGIAFGWLALFLCFAVGFKKRLTYFLVFFFHALGTFFTIPNLIPGTEDFKILFFAAIPTAAAMWLLWILRDQDTLFSLKN